MLIGFRSNKHIVMFGYTVKSWHVRDMHGF